MPITRTEMVDDDGSGITGTIINNAWKQQFYDQIDALGVGLPIVSGVWTPVDASGAGLALTIATAQYAKIGRLVFLAAYVAYPTTANGAAAKLGGLPFAATHYAGAYQTYGAIPIQFYLPVSNTIELLQPTGGARTNVTLSGAAFALSAVYLTT